MAAALIAIAAALALPFLPVTQQQSTVSWPQASSLTSITSPLVSYAPTRFSADIPCSALAALDDTGGVAVSTIPRQSPDMERYGFVVKVVADSPDRLGRVDVVSRNTLLWSAPLESVRARSCAIGVRIDAQQATVTGIPDAAHSTKADLRPQVVGVFTELEGSAPPGLGVAVEVDSRFSLSPTPVKVAAQLTCLFATLLSLVLLHRQDRCDGRATRRFLPPRWWRPRPVERTGARHPRHLAFHRRQHLR
ncbi:arabinosyltransferase domain-containing protein [Nocardia asteroides]